MGDEPTLEELYEDAPCGYVSVGPDGAVTRANRTFLRSIGRPADEIVGRRLVDLMTAGSRLYADTHWGPRLELQGELREMPVDLLRPDGSRLSVLLNATLVRRADGTEGGFRASLFDATDRRRYERDLIAARDVERAARQRVERLQRLSAGLAEALETGHVAVALADAVFDGIAPRRCTVLHEGQVAGERRETFAVPGPTKIAETPLRSGDRAIGTLVLELPEDRLLTEDDDAFLSACAASGAIALRRAQLYAEMQRLALQDPVTGLPNRLVLRERLDLEIDRTRDDGRRFAVALLGLDGFKLLNDTRGHAAGDEILRLVGTRLRSAVGEGRLVARLSGDEFAVVCADGDGEGVAEALVAALDEPVPSADGDVFLRASVGVVLAGGDADAESVLRDADVAMMVAKRTRAGQWVTFDASMRERTRERALIEEGLRVALRDAHLRVAYQPIVRASDGALTGLEALMRWFDPARGMVSPADFIPVAEECGLIVDMGRWVLGEAATQLAAWRAEGLVGEHVGMTVNVSARQLDRPDFADDVAAALDASGLRATPGLLGLELTESMVMDAAGGDPVARLAELSALGVRLLLDDFGTGTSSLARLRRLPFDTLKIDRAFVTGLGEGEAEDDAIVAAIVALAGALDLRVVAEGVETEAQLAHLRDLGADAIQGFLFSRPLPPRELEARFLTSS